MERKISLSEVQKAVDEAYEQNKSTKAGAVDPRVAGQQEAGKFGISVVLTDGTEINKADTDALFAMGNLAKLPISVVLLSQNTADEVVKKSGSDHHHDHTKPHIPFSAHGVRAVSAIEPQNDPDGKYDIILNKYLDMTDNATPVLNDKLYQAYQKQIADEKVVDALANAGYYLYDNAGQACDIFTKLMSLQTTTRQLAMAGATVAADGRNPKSGEYAFDGSIAASVVALYAVTGPHHCKRAWAMETGLPGKGSFAGGILAILPGFGAIAAYAPETDENQLSVKAYGAIKYIANKLGLNVYSSARVSVEK